MAETDANGATQRWFIYGNYIDEPLMMVAKCLDNTDPINLFAHTLYYVQDALYSTRALVAYTGWVIEEQTAYDVYGNPTTWTSGDADADRDIDSGDWGKFQASYDKSKCDPNYNWRCDADNSGGVKFPDMGAFIPPRYSSTPANQQSFFTNPYYFTGRRVDLLDDGNLQLQHNRNRHYDYYTGRWLTHDALGINYSIGGMPNPPSSQAVQYVDGMNLYGYLNSSPLNAGDPFGLWGWFVHCGRTEWWAKEVGMCFRRDIAKWNNDKDKGLNKPWLAYVISVAADVMSIVSGGAWHFASAITNLNLKRVAKWHFPGADLGKPVVPGGWAAERVIKKSLPPHPCNLKKFSEGLHQLQDSYAHQSNGKLVTWWGKGWVGHSRDRYGWNTDNWNDPAATGLSSSTISTLTAMSGGVTALKQWRQIRVALSTDADIPSSSADIQNSYEDTGDRTKEWMEEFLDKCPCIEKGPYKGECTRCSKR